MHLLNCRPATAYHSDPPHSQSLCTPINNALFGLSCCGEVCHTLVDIAAVIWELASKPTHASGLAKKMFGYIGYCDASLSQQSVI
jgi:hypothetical protein